MALSSRQEFQRMIHYMSSLLTSAGVLLRLLSDRVIMLHHLLFDKPFTNIKATPKRVDFR